MGHQAGGGAGPREPPVHLQWACEGTMETPSEGLLPRLPPSPSWTLQLGGALCWALKSTLIWDFRAGGNSLRGGQSQTICCTSGLGRAQACISERELLGSGWVWLSSCESLGLIQDSELCVCVGSGFCI